MNFMEIVRSKKAELGAVLSVSAPSTENDQVSVQGIEVTPAAVYRAIGDVLENVWLVLSDNLQTDLEPDQVSEWVDTLEWAVEVMPSGYKRHVEIIKTDLDYWQSFL